MRSFEGEEIILRVDGDALIGSGHVMRCLALAQAWQDAGGGATFLSARLSDVLEKRLKADGCSVKIIDVDIGSVADADFSAEAARDAGAHYIVADGYNFGVEFQRRVKAEALKLMIVDDNGENGRYCCDAVLNQNTYADEDLYSNREEGTSLCLGNSYALLRKEFRKYSGWERVSPDSVGKILVTLGGGEFVDLTCGIVEELRKVIGSELEVKVVVGGGVVGLAKLDDMIKAAGDSFSLYCNVSNMAELMAWADMSISAAGSACWEQAFMGLPIITVVVADNQEHLADNLERAGVSMNAGCLRCDNLEKIGRLVCKLVSDKCIRVSMVEAGRRLVDGKGALRVVRTIKTNLE